MAQAAGQVRGPRTPLTTAEQRVIDGIERRLTYRAIGRELAALARRKSDVSEHTVRAHVRNIARKLDGLEDVTSKTRIYLWVTQGRQTK